jgi:tRNA A37 methylthiotransferase MiaB
MRGSHRSRTQRDIVAEAKALIADGVKEINLISQDSTYYGLDLRPNTAARFRRRKNFLPPPNRLPPMPRPFARCCAN